MTQGANGWRVRVPVQVRAVLATACLVLLAACGKAELYGKLSETQANEMIAVLQRAGIESSKSDGGEAGWTLTTDKGDFGRAVEVLQSQGYPRQDYASLGTVFKGGGVVSSPTEERARLIYGLSQELSHTISEIDGVVQARVHLALPQDRPLAEQQQPSSASVFIKYRPGTDINSQIGKVKALVVNSVEGLKVENVSVETFAARPVPVAQVGAAGGSMRASLGTVAALIGLLGVGLVGYPSLRRWQQRRAAAVRREQV